MHACRRLLPLLALAGALAAPAAAPAAVTEFSANLTRDKQPADITRGPDGNLWFTEQGGAGAIGRITPAGAITEYVAGVATGFTVGQGPSHITAGPDGALWFTEAGVTGQIGRLDPTTGTVTEFATGITPNRAPTGIAKGPDGNLWFTEAGGAGAIGRITPTGLVTEYIAGLTANSTPTDIAAGKDGNLWFTESADPGRIGRIDPATGTITEFSSGLTANGAPGQIAAAGSKLYFTEGNDPGRLGRIKTDGTIQQYTSGLTANSRPGDIAEGGDGALWFTSSASPGRIGRLWPDTGTITELPAGSTPGFTADAVPAGITKGPDGNVWFTESASPGRITRVTVPPAADIEKPVSLGGGGVRLKATIAPNSQATTYFIEWGPDSGFDHETATLSAGSGAGDVDVSTDVTLTLDAHYHARVTATNASGTAASEDLPFYLAVDGSVVKEKPASDGSSTVDPGQDDQGQNDQGDTPGDNDPGHDDHGLAPAAAPVLGHAVTLQPLSGHVFVKPPGAATFVALALGANVQVGSLVDTRHGRVVLESARDAHGRTQKGTFWGAIFQIRQARKGRGVTDLALRGGSFARCATGVKAAASMLARDSGRRHHAIRRLWGKDRHSRFRTHGRDSVATVRGTQWVTTDRCDGTLTRVKRGAVMVRDLRRHRSHLLTAGHAYLARHRQR